VIAIDRHPARGRGAARGERFPKRSGKFPDPTTAGDAAAAPGAQLAFGTNHAPGDAVPFRARRLATMIVVLTGHGLLAHSPSSAGPLPAAAASLDAAVRVMTLGEALAHARVRHPAVKSALARVAAVGADARIPRAQWLPTLGATVQGFEATANNTTASYVGVRGIDVPRIGGTRVAATGDWSPSLSTLAAIGGTQEIFDFGRVAVQAAFADLAYQAETHRADAERLRVTQLVKEAYYAVLGARAVAHAAEDARQRAQVHREMAAAEVRSGLHPPIELTRSEADLARFEVGTIRARGSLRSAQAVFAAAVGVDEPLLDAGGDPGAIRPLPPFAELTELAATRDPALREARTRADAADALARAIAAETRPDLVLTGTVSGRGGAAEPTTGPLATDHPGLPTVPNWDVGLVLRWPLFDPVVAARAHAAAVRVEVARADLAGLRQQQAARLQEAYVALQVALAALSSLQRAVDASHANYAQAEARFKAGLGTSLELADAEGVRTDAEIQLAVGQFEAHRSHAVIARLTGEDS
jgi:outer membrane protein